MGDGWRYWQRDEVPGQNAKWDCRIARSGLWYRREEVDAYGARFHSPFDPMYRPKRIIEFRVQKYGSGWNEPDGYERRQYFGTTGTYDWIHDRLIDSEKELIQQGYERITPEVARFLTSLIRDGE